MKILSLSLIALCSFINSFSNKYSYRSPQQGISGSCFIKPDTSIINTFDGIKTVNELKRRRNFKGIVTVDGKILNDNDPFLDRNAKDIHIKKIVVITKVPTDSIKKYGQKAVYGMIIIDTY